MSELIEDIKNRLQAVEERIASACAKAGRKPEEITLVAVSKTKAADTVRAGIAAGLTILGENYIQEAQGKIEEIGRDASWHFIGHLQSNKAKYAVKLFDVIHSVHSLKLAKEIDKKAGAAGVRPEVYVQVNISGEETKGGIDPSSTKDLVQQVAELPNLELRGLMTMPPFFDQPERARPFFVALNELKEKIGAPITELSMGMSGDFEVAIEEGATIVRVGSALFGPRT